ncbi:MAG: ComEA family DNA-binding protein [Desulforhopalus sp.]
MQCYYDGLIFQGCINIKSDVSFSLERRELANNCGINHLANDKTRQQRDGRLTILLAFGGCFLAFVLIGYLVVPVLHSRGVSDCKKLTISVANVLMVDSCRERKDKTTIVSHLTPFFYEDVQINKADKEMLMTVKGVGPSLADKILEYRKTKGPFNNPKDLLNLDGVGRKKGATLATKFNFTQIH